MWYLRTHILDMHVNDTITKYTKRKPRRKNGGRVFSGLPPNLNTHPAPMQASNGSVAPTPPPPPSPQHGESRHPIVSSEGAIRAGRAGRAAAAVPCGQHSKRDANKPSRGRGVERPVSNKAAGTSINITEKSVNYLKKDSVSRTRHVKTPLWNRCHQSQPQYRRANRQPPVMDVIPRKHVLVNMSKTHSSIRLISCY